MSKKNTMKRLSDNEWYKALFEIGLLLTLMIGFGIYSNIENLRWFFVDSKDYHQTSGEILSANVEAGGTYGSWRFAISYRYKVGNQEFVSNRVHFGYQAMADPSYALSYVQKYPAGKQVVVFYDENNPSNSVLEPQVKWNGLLDFYLLILLLPITIFGMSAYFFVKSRQQSNPSLTNGSW